MIIVEEIMRHNEVYRKRGLIVDKDSVKSIVCGELKNLGQYYRYGIDQNLYNFIKNNKKDILTILVQIDNKSKISKLHSGICQETDTFKKLSTSERRLVGWGIRCTHNFTNDVAIFDNFIFLEFLNNKVHAKAKLLFS